MTCFQRLMMPFPEYKTDWTINCPVIFFHKTSVNVCIIWDKSPVKLPATKSCTTFLSISVSVNRQQYRFQPRRYGLRSCVILSQTTRVVDWHTFFYVPHDNNSPNL